MSGTDSLLKLTALVRDAAEAELSALARKDRALCDALARLQSDRARSRAGFPEGLDPATRAGAEVAWHRWIEERSAAINRERARLQVQMANARARFSTALGRQNAMKEIAALEADQRRRRNEARWQD
jgi:hypothetical protein